MAGRISRRGKSPVPPTLSHHDVHQLARHDDLLDDLPALDHFSDAFIGQRGIEYLILAGGDKALNSGLWGPAPGRQRTYARTG